MRNKLFTLFFAVLASVGMMNAEIIKCVQIGNLSYNLDVTNKTAEVTSQVTSQEYYIEENYSGLTATNIPDSVEYNSVTYSVTSIGDYAFNDCRTLTSIEISNHVTSIGRDAFYGCSDLASVTIPNSVTIIGEYAFDFCSSLKSVTIPNSVTNIGEEAFTSTGLTSIEIPNSVISIGRGAFSHCDDLIFISVESGNPTYDSRENCNAIIETATNTLIAGCQNTIIPNSITSIGYEAFEACNNLTSIEIPSSVTSIEDYAFSLCYGLVSIVIPSSVTSIGRNAFYACKFSSIVIPKSVTNISRNAFFCCDRLTSINVESGNPTYDSRENCNAIIETATNTLIAGCQNTTIPNSVTSIGENAFYSTDITSIEIPNSVTSIGREAFSCCYSLKSVKISDLAAWCNIIFSTASSNPLYNAHHLYLNDVEITDMVIPNSVTSIGENAFYGCSGLTSVKIPSSVTTIGNDAFRDCSGLTNLIIPNSITRLKSATFWGCSGLTSITCEAITPPTCEGNYKYIFYQVDKTIPVYVPAKSVDAYMTANGWSEFTNIQAIPGPEPCIIASGTCGDSLIWELSCDSVLTISGTGAMTDWDYGKQNYAPWYDYSKFVVTAILPEGLTHIGHSAFFGCSKLQNINIPNSVTSVGEYAFTIASNSLFPTISGMKYADTYLLGPSQNLSSYVIREGTKWIGTQAFYTVAIFSITIPNSVIGICSGAFIYSGLSEVLIPDNVVTIGNSAFFNCDSLKDVIIGSGVKWIGSLAFSNCKSISSITCKAVVPPALEEAQVFLYTSKNIPLYVPAESIDAYKAADEWKEFTNILPIPGTEVPEYPVIFLNYNSDVLSEQSVAEGSAAVAPEVPEREGYIFKGWNVDIEHIVARTFAIALYDKVGVEVTYKAEDGEVLFSEHADLHFPNVPSIDGKTFSGWLTEMADNTNGIVLRATYTVDKPTEDDDVNVVPSSTTADVNFPYVTGAITYMLVISDMSDQVVCKIMFDANGKLLGIAFAPGRNGNKQQTPQVFGFTFKVEGLNPNTTYKYEFVAHDDEDEVIETLTGSFTTMAEAPSDVEYPEAENLSSVTKFIQDDQVLILRGDKAYTATGQEVK